LFRLIAGAGFGRGFVYERFKVSKQPESLMAVLLPVLPTRISGQCQQLKRYGTHIEKGHCFSGKNPGRHALAVVESKKKENFDSPRRVEAKVRPQMTNAISQLRLFGWSKGART